MDAASNRSVEDMTALLERAMYAPTQGRFKVYMIDEVHMLSSTAFNAMLKTLEEPPEYVKFILATTELHKVPATILSRCQRHSFKRIPDGPRRLEIRFAHAKADYAIHHGSQIEKFPDAGRLHFLYLI